MAYRGFGAALHHDADRRAAADRSGQMAARPAANGSLASSSGSTAAFTASRVPSTPRGRAGGKATTSNIPACGWPGASCTMMSAISMRSSTAVQGWKVITPLQTGNGDIVLVDRGFVPEELKLPATRERGQMRGVDRNDRPCAHVRAARLVHAAQRCRRQSLVLARCAGADRLAAAGSGRQSCAFHRRGAGGACSRRLAACRGDHAQHPQPPSRICADLVLAGRHAARRLRHLRQKPPRIGGQGTRPTPILPSAGPAYSLPHLFDAS